MPEEKNEREAHQDAWCKPLAQNIADAERRESQGQSTRIVRGIITQKCAEIQKHS